MKIRKYNLRPFETWRNSQSSLGEYLWPQLDYRLSDLQSYHVCWEVRPENKLANNPAGLAKAPISFIHESQTLLMFESSNKKTALFANSDGQVWKKPETWIPNQWYKTLSAYSGLSLASKLIRQTPTSYDSYHRSARLENVSCVDFDFLEPCRGKTWIAIETTHFFKPMFNREEAIRLVKFVIEKRFSLPKAHQLEVQTNWASKYNLQFWIVFYNKKDNYLDTAGKIFRAEVTKKTLKVLTGRISPDFSSFIYESFSDFHSWLETSKQ